MNDEEIKKQHLCLVFLLMALAIVLLITKAADFVLYQPGDFMKVRCKRVTVLGEWKE